MAILMPYLDLSEVHPPADRFLTGCGADPGVPMGNHLFQMRGLHAGQFE
jgi:hypothetical protein